MYRWMILLWTATCYSALAGQPPNKTSTHLDSGHHRLRVVKQENPRTLAANYQLWIPAGCKKVRFVIAVNQRAAGRRIYFRDHAWREMATRMDAAMLWCGFEAQEIQHNGGGESMLAALDGFAVSTEHPELAESCLLLWGHSMGGRVAQDFVRWKPRRVLGFVMALRGNPSDPEFMHEPFEAMEVPGLYLMGDLDAKPADIREHFIRARQNGAPRAWIWLPSQNHWPKGMSFGSDKTSEADWQRWAAHQVVLPWIEEIARVRIRQDSTQLAPLASGDGWLVIQETPILVKASRFAGDRSSASWFPSKRAAQACLDYLSSFAPRAATR